MKLPKQLKFLLVHLPLSAILIGLLVLGAYKIQSLDRELSGTQASPGASITNDPSLSQVAFANVDQVLHPLHGRCASLLFFTSAPAKCKDAQGNLIWVNSNPAATTNHPGGK